MAMMMVTMVMVMAVIMRSYLVFYSTGSMESFGHATVVVIVERGGEAKRRYARKEGRRKVEK